MAISISAPANFSYEGNSIRQWRSIVKGWEEGERDGERDGQKRERDGWKKRERERERRRRTVAGVYCPLGHPHANWLRLCHGPLYDSWLNLCIIRELSNFSSRITSIPLTERISSYPLSSIPSFFIRILLLWRFCFWIWIFSRIVNIIIRRMHGFLCSWDYLKCRVELCVCTLFIFIYNCKRM